MTLGSTENAREALRLNRRSWIKSKDYPNGWKKLGSGGTRNAYLGPDGVVYKVQHNSMDKCNVDEAAASRRLRDNKRLAAQGVFVPKARTWRVEGEHIIAMEYIDGKPSRCSMGSWNNEKCNCRTFGTPRICFGVLYEMLEQWGFNDCFYSNVFHTPDNKIWLIDLGYENGSY